jgi:hypothetical protein
MSVMVQYIVKVSDVDRFVTTSEKFAPMMEEMGGRNGGVYEDENDPSLVSTISEWESHDQMHEAIEKYDDQFNEEAGTADLRWTTQCRVFEPLTPSITSSRSAAVKIRRPSRTDVIAGVPSTMPTARPRHPRARSRATG